MHVYAYVGVGVGVCEHALETMKQFEISPTSYAKIIGNKEH